MALEIALPKSKALTLSNLAKHDDIITDALVDRVYYWTTIRKNRAKYLPMRAPRDEEVANIIRKTIIVEKDPTKATQQIIELKGINNYYRGLDSETEQEHFTRHLRKYVNMYMPDCPFEINTTNRFLVTEYEAAATARKQIKKGEVIKYLSGTCVAMTKEEEKNLDLTRRDFSIVMSSRKKTPSLFLGPARFANHDCCANARLSTRGSNGMQIMAVRDIQVDEEITVTYGDDYFGEDNCECLCSTCEKEQRNGWDPMKKSEDSDDEDEDEDEDEDSEESLGTATPQPKQEEIEPQDGPYTFRNKRKYVVEPASSTPESEKPSKRRKTKSEDQYITLAVLDYSGPSNEPAIKMERTDSNFSNAPLSSVLHKPIQPSLLSPHRRAMQTYAKHSRYSSSTMDSDIRSPRSSSADAAASPSTEATSVCDDPIGPSTSDKPTTLITQPTNETTNEPYAESESDLSVMSSTCEFDHQTKSIVKRRRTRYQAALQPLVHSPHRLSSQPRQSSTTGNDPPSERLNKRYPGDYIKPTSLLSLKYSRWNTCTNDAYSGSTFHFPPPISFGTSSFSLKTPIIPPSGTSIEEGCRRVFVQENGYLTRACCPRCERHSMLYGYAWPKTDKESKKDDEERVVDHRTVHRFLSPETERRRRLGLPPRSEEEEEEERRKAEGKKEKDLLRKVMKGRVEKGEKKKLGRPRKDDVIDVLAADVAASLSAAGGKLGRPRKEVREEKVEEEKVVITKSGRTVHRKSEDRKRELKKKTDENKYKPSPWKGWVLVDE
ncbi:MAG: Histone-lysine N-methyltransferase set9 [Bogoriella megaspora]|nr:MAG: Histone-lysine N-methyltransferase set9 [Bogoriella megaspora]